MRSDGDVRRGAPLTLLVDGQAVAAFEGETIATAIRIGNPLLKPLLLRIV